MRLSSGCYWQAFEWNGRGSASKIQGDSACQDKKTRGRGEEAGAEGHEITLTSCRWRSGVGGLPSGGTEVAQRLFELGLKTRTQSGCSNRSVMLLKKVNTRLWCEIVFCWSANM